MTLNNVSSKTNRAVGTYVSGHKRSRVRSQGSQQDFFLKDGLNPLVQAGH